MNNSLLSRLFTKRSKTIISILLTLAILVPSLAFPGVAQAVPLAPNTLRAVVTAGTRNIVLTWNDPALGVELGFYVYKDTVNTFNSINLLKTQVVGPSVAPVAPATAWTGTFTEIATVAGGTFFYKVTAYDLTGESVASNVVTIVVPSAAPTLLTAVATANTRNTVLNWTSNSFGTELGFYIQRDTVNTFNSPNLKVSSIGPALAPVAPAVTWTQTYTDVASVTGGTYFYRVMAYALNSQSGPSNTATATKPAATPTALAGTIVTGTGNINLRWTSASAGTEQGFYIYGDTVNTFNSANLMQASVGTGVTTYTTTPTVTGVPWFFRVSAFDLTGQTAFSNVLQITAPNVVTIPATPSNLVATVVTTARIDLTWTDNAIDEIAYRVQRATNATFTAGLTNFNLAAGAVSYSNTTPNTNTTYYFRVDCSNAGGTSGASNVVQTRTATPTGPTGVTATATGPTQINLVWVAPAIPNQTTFRIDRATDTLFTANLVTVNNVARNLTTYSDTTVAANTAYYYRIFAVNGIGTSVASATAGPVTTPVTPTVPSAPTGLTAVAASATQVNLSWTVVGTPTALRVERSTSADFSANLVPFPMATATTAAYSDTTTVKLTTYYYRVIATNAIGDSTPSIPANVTTPDVAPTQPSNLTATVVSPNVRLNWTDNSNNETGFVVQRATDNAFTAGLTSFNVGTEIITYLDLTAAPSSTYFYRVYATNVIGNSGNSNVVSASTVAIGAPLAPSGLAAAAPTTTSVNLTWTNNDPNQSGVRVERATDATFTTGLTAFSLGATIAAYADTVLPNVTYFYRVFATNSFGDSIPSATASVSTSNAIPLAPTVLITTMANSYQINLSWIDNSSNESGFRIYTALNSAFTLGFVTIDLPANTTTFSDTTVYPGDTFYYKVTAYNSVGESAPTNVTNIVILLDAQTVPGAPSELTATLAAGNQVDLAWLDNSPIEAGYVIERALDNLFSIGVTTFLLPAQANVFSDTTASPETTYYYRVMSFNYLGNSLPSNTASITTAAIAVAAPTNLRGDVSGAAQISLSWLDNAINETGYVVDRATNAAFTIALVSYTLPSNSNSYTNSTTVVAGTTYFYRVIATNPAGNSAPTNIISVRAGVPVAPSGLVGTGTGPASIGLTWVDNANNELSYQVQRSSTIGFTLGVSTFVLPTNSTTYTDTGLMKLTTYYYRVLCINAAGVSPASAIVTVITLDNVPPQLVNLVATATQATRIVLTWANATPALNTSIRIERAADPAFAGAISTFTTGAATITYTDATVVANTTYYYRVFAVNATGPSSASNTASTTTPATTPAAIPAAPTGLTATLINSGQINLAWTHNGTNLGGFNIETTTDPAFLLSVITIPLASNLRAYSDFTIYPGATFYYRIKATNVLGVSAASATLNVIVPAAVVGPPAAPGGLNAAVVSTTELTLNWVDNATNETGFLLYRATNTAFTTSLTSFAIGPNTATYSDTSVSPGILYYYRICSYNVLGVSAMSGAIAASTTGSVIPAAPTNLSAAATSATQIDLAWVDNANNETGYRVERASDAAFTANLASFPLGAGIISYSNTGLTELTTYYFRVFAVNAVGDSMVSNTANAATLSATAPAGPTGLSATLMSTSRIDLGWTLNGTAETAVRLERASDSVFTIGLTTINLLARVQAYSDTTVLLNNVYYYRVFAVNTSGASTPSGTVSINMNVPSTPSTVTATPVSSTRIDLAWTSTSATAEGFQIDRAVNNNFNAGLMSFFAPAGATTYSDTSASPNTAYFYRIQAFNSILGNSAYSAPVPVTALNVVPGAPLNLTALTVSPARVDLVWNRNGTNETGFRIERALDTAFTNSPATFTLGGGIQFYSDVTTTLATTYYYRIYATNAAGDSPVSNTATTTTPNLPPSAASGLTATMVNAYQINLAWTNNATNATTMRIERATNTAFTAWLTSFPVAIGNTTFSDTTTGPNNRYYYRIFTGNAVGTSPSSNVATVATPDLPPLAPSSLNAQSVSHTRIDLTWVNNATNQSGFRVERASNAWLSGWAKRLVITLDHTKVNSALSHFPVMLHLSASSGMTAADVSGIFTDLGTNSLKIAATQADGTTLLYAEIEKWDATNKEAVLWISSPGWAISNTADTTVYLYYDPTQADNTAYVGVPGSTAGLNVWDANYAAVYHMNDNPDISHVLDSTSNVNNGAKIGAGLPSETAGRAGNAQLFDGSDDITVNNSSSLGVSSAITIESWINATAFTNAGGIARKPAAYSLQNAWNGIAGYAPGKLDFQLVAGGIDTHILSSNIYTTGTWLNFVGVYDGTRASIIVNNVLERTVPLTGAIGVSSNSLTLGQDGYLNRFAGTIDEIRISKTARSAGWIAASYASTTDNLCSFNGVQTGPAGPATFVSLVTTSRTTTSYSDTTVSPSISYQYRVFAISTGGETVSNLVTITSLPLPVPGIGEAPSNLIADAIGTTWIDLNWTDNSSPTTTINGFTIERAPDVAGSPGAFAVIGTVASAVTNFSDNNPGNPLTATTTYHYRVAAFNATGPSAYSNVASTTTATNPTYPTAPTGLTAVFQLGPPRGILVSWTLTSTNQTAILLQRANNSTFTLNPVTLYLPATTTNYLDTNIASGNVYYYKVVALGSASPPSVTVGVVIPPMPPVDPTGLAAQAISTTQIDLTWTDNANDETGYRVERATNDTFTSAFSTFTLGANAISYSDTSVVASTAYFYRVFAFNDGGDSLASNTANVTTPGNPAAPPAPSNLTASPVSSTRIDLSWNDNSTNETGFNIDRSADGAFSATTSFAVAAGVTSFTDIPLTAGTAYFYRVYAVNGVGLSVASNTASATTPDVPPVAPTGLGASVISAAQINLAWTDNSNNETGFRIERATNSAFSAGLTTFNANANATIYNDTAAVASTAYYYRVFAVNASGSSPASTTVTATTPGLLPAAPSNVTAIAASSTSVNVNWTDNASTETGFRIERATNSAFSAGLTPATVAANVTTYADNSTVGAMTYFYRVFATNTSGDSAASNTATVTTPTTIPTAPSALTATTVNSTRVNLAWTNNATNQAGFTLQRATDAGFGIGLATMNISSPTATTYGDTTVVPSTTYFYRIYAVNAAGSSTASNTATAATAVTIPNAPGNAAATAITQNQVNITWTDNSQDETGFRVERATDVAFTVALMQFSVAANVTLYSDISAAPGTAYNYRVIAFNTAGDSAPSVAPTATTAASTIPGPTGLTGTIISASQVDLAWTCTAINLTGFRVERATNTTFTAGLAQFLIAAGALAYSDTTAAGTTTYSYRVIAYDANGDSPASNVVTITTPNAAAPAAPSGLTATVFSGTQVNLVWFNNAIDQTGFRVERATDAAFMVALTPFVIVDPLAVAYSDITAVPLAVYYYRVFATNAAGDSVVSNSATVTMPNVVPAAPTLLTGTAISGTQIDLAWTNNATNQTGFRVERATDTLFTVALVSFVITTPTTVTYSDVTVAPLTTYYYRVFATNAIGNSLASNTATVTTLNIVPAAPSGLTVLAITGTQVNLTWVNNATNQTGFRVERATDVNFTAGLTSYIVASATALTYNDIAASALTTYFYRVFATNAVGSSLASNTASTATPAAGAPTAPSGLTASTVTGPQVILIWVNNATTQTGFRVERATDAAFTAGLTPFVVASAAALTYTDTTPTATTLYYYRVFATNASGNSLASNTASVTTTTGGPTSPANLTAVKVNDKRIDLTWSDMSNDELGFRIESDTVQTFNSTNNITFQVAANATTYSDGSVYAGDTFFYRITAYNASGTSAPSNVASVNIPLPTAGVPIAPNAFSATLVGTNQVDLTWNDNSTGEIGFMVERATTDAFTSPQSFTTAANVTTYSDMAVPNGTYYYRVKAFNALGNSGDSASATITIGTTGGSTGGSTTGGTGGFAGGGFTPIVPTTTVAVTGFTTDSTAPKVDSTGVVRQIGILQSSDQKAKVVIPENTKMLDSKGVALANITCDIVKAPPAPPANNIIVSDCDFGPDGATFNPPITVTLKFNPADIPAGVNPADLKIAFWDGTQWQILSGTVNLQNNEVSAPVSHFTSFTLLSPQPPPPPKATFSVSNMLITPKNPSLGQAVTVYVNVTNTSAQAGSYDAILKINNVTENTKKVDLAPGAATEVSFSITKATAGTYNVDINGLSSSFTIPGASQVTPPTSSTPTVTPTSSTPTQAPTSTTSPTVTTPTSTPAVDQPVTGFNWWIIVAIGGAIVVGILGGWLVLRKRGKKEVGQM